MSSLGGWCMIVSSMNSSGTVLRNRRALLRTAAVLASATSVGTSAAAQKGGVELRHRSSSKRIRVLAGVMAWRLTPAETDNAYFMLETIVGPGGGVPPHRHPEQEGFYVVEGEVEYGWIRNSGVEAARSAIDWSVARAGDSVQIPGYAWHGWRNATSQPARILVTGPGRLGRFFEEAGVSYAGDGPVGPPAPDDLKRVSVVMAKYGHEFLK